MHDTVKKMKVGVDMKQLLQLLALLEVSKSE
jgi:hypothetical protein